MSAQAAVPDHFCCGIPNIFAAAKGKHLTDQQLDGYIDRSVTGPDRALAHKFMWMMPRTMRGDFVYVDSHDHIVTNNPRLIPYIKVTHRPNAQAAVRSVADATPVRRTMSNGYSSSCSPPNPPAYPKGGYERQVSKCGFTSGITFVHLPCGTSSLQPGDSGYMYMELRGDSGSLGEGGMFVANNNDHSINPYVTGTQTMNNGAARYDCAYDLGFESGATLDGKYIFTAAGELPSTCAPEKSFCNGSEFTYVNQAWLFADAPGDINGSGWDAVGVQTPCVNCSISRVTTIAQPVNTYTEDGSLFASDAFGTVYLHYMQTAFGEWESNCEPGTSLCTFVYSIHPTDYYGGFQYYPNLEDVASVINPSLGATYGPWESFDGINMICCSTSSKTADLTTNQAFVETIPTYMWRERGYKNPGVERVTNWEVSSDNGASYQTYCTASHTADYPPYEDLGGEDCDGYEDTDHPSLPYPGGIQI